MDINNLWADLGLRTENQDTRCLAVNTILQARYLVGPVLSMGGMYIIYEGYDLSDETRVHIQEYFPENLVSRNTAMFGDRILQNSTETSSRYRRGMEYFAEEAMTMAQFSAVPGLCSVKDMFNENTTVYIIRERVVGRTLRKYFFAKEKRLAEEKLLAVLRPVMEALVEIHKAGIFHGELTDDNIILTDDGKVKLVGLDVSHKIGENEMEEPPVVVLHSVGAMEQYHRGDKLGPWTDVYGVCALMYYMLSGICVPPVNNRFLDDPLKSFEELGVEVSPNTTAAIRQGLQVWPKSRIQDIPELMGYLYEGKMVPEVASVPNGQTMSENHATSEDDAEPAENLEQNEKTLLFEEDDDSDEPEGVPNKTGGGLMAKFFGIFKK